MEEADADYVRLCLDGHPEMFRHLVVRYEAPIRRHLAARLGDANEAAEAAQETLVRAYFALPGLKKAESFSTWLLGIADRVAKEAHRARRRRGAPVDVGAVADIAGLPDTHRQVVLMRFYGGQSCAEIGRNLGVSLGTVTSRLSRAYALLREAMRNHVRDAEVDR
jgi:RNA polymerase sigma-70 factor (ECF subfamily)